MTFVDPRIAPHLIGDPGRVSQVLLNFISNAIKFTHKGSIVVRADLIEQNEVDTVLRFTVKDTGIGLASSTIKNLFRPFTQGDASTARKYGGTGLGLSICKRLVDLMGGKIGVESQEGVGSAFWFQIRLGHQIKPGQVLDSGPRLSKAVRVLIVDNDEISLSLVTEYLSSFGAEVAMASGTHEALELIKSVKGNQVPFDFVLTDLRMPDPDGFALARQIRALPLPAQPKLILMTAFDDGSQTLAQQKAGFSACLRKPFKKSELFSAFERIIQNPQASLNEHDPASTETSTAYPSQRRILLAEDNAVNQQLAQVILERQGYLVQSVANGIEALKAMTLASFDLVIMDCQMPEMDGYQATIKIRELERKFGGHIPILALTANVQKEDREHCLATGMDDYLAKPIRKEALLEAVGRCLSHGARAINPETLMHLQELQSEADPELVARLIGIFLQSSPPILEKLRQAIETENATEIQLQAHSLKSSAASLGAEALAAVCKEVEMLGRHRGAKFAKTKLSEIDRHYRAAEIELLDFVKVRERKRA